MAVGKVRWPDPAKIFAGLLTSHPDLLAEAKVRLAAHLGPIDLESEVWDFKFTDYYQKEMGPKLKRQFVSFSHLQSPEELPRIKILTNQIEWDLAVEGKRRVNIDPGYVNLAKLVLATTKDYSHRLYLGHGIYGEVTLIYRKGGWQALPWTYMDYRSQSHLEFFLRLRELYRRQLRSATSYQQALSCGRLEDKLPNQEGV